MNTTTTHLYRVSTPSVITHVHTILYIARTVRGSDGQAHETRPTTSLAHDLAKHLGDDAPDDVSFCCMRYGNISTIRRYIFWFAHMLFQSFCWIQFAIFMPSGVGQLRRTVFGCLPTCGKNLKSVTIILIHTNLSRENLLLHVDKSRHATHMDINKLWFRFRIHNFR